MKRLSLFALLALMVAAVPNVFAARDYGLAPQQIADGVYVLEGRQEHFTFANGGNIVNTGFIIGDDGVVVIDSGPSRLYGEALRTAITQITEKPIAAVLITHFHPDHFLGNQAFEDVPIFALTGTVAGIETQGELFNDAMYRLVGPWMKGTRIVMPSPLPELGDVSFGGRALELTAFAGHSGNDLVILDKATGAVFAGDLAFLHRTPTTPHADLARWREDLMALRAMDYTKLVPGHGPVVDDHRAVDQTLAYLGWLGKSLARRAEAGDSMAEVLEPEATVGDFRGLAVFDEEYQRSVAHLFPVLEEQAIGMGTVHQEKE